MKQKFPLLPRHIIKESKYYYRDTKTGSRHHVSTLGSLCPVEPETYLKTQELKDQIIQSSRWDLNY